MAKSIASLIKTVKEIEDENKRGSNALEAAIGSIEQELNTFNSKLPWLPPMDMAA